MHYHHHSDAITYRLISAEDVNYTITKPACVDTQLSPATGYSHIFTMHDRSSGFQRNLSLIMYTARHDVQYLALAMLYMPSAHCNQSNY